MAMQLPFMPTLTTGGPAPFRLEPDGSMTFPSSFGLGADRDWDAAAFLDSQRVKQLQYNRSFFACVQHDAKPWDYNGAASGTGPSWMRAGMQSAMAPTMFIPHALRRPSAPIRLLRTVVKRYTAMLFGKHRWPNFKVPGDSQSTDFVNALVKAEKLHAVMSRARNIGGSTGTVGLSWRFFEGKPRVLAHNPCFLDVHAWADREACIPSHVTQCYPIVRQEYDPKTKKTGLIPYWFRRDWTEHADVVFYPVRADAKGVFWQVNEEESVEHGDGFCHFVWIQNAPPDDDDSIDGMPDYHGVDESSLTLDVLNSVNVTGTLKNLDPTLVLKVEQKRINSVRKGSDNALLVGESGGASYLELPGQAATAGATLVASQRKFILETCECVIPDPDELTAAGMSSVAIQELYSPMTSQTDVLRVSYGTGIERLIEQQVASYRRTVDTRDPETGEKADLVEVGEDGEEIQIEHVLDLPPKVVEEEGEDGTRSISLEPVSLGPSERVDVELEWPPYFEQSANEVQAEAGAMVAANGGKPVMSQQTAVERFARAIGIDPVEEWRRVQAQLEAAAMAEGGMFPGAGGEVPYEDKPAATGPLLTKSHTAAIVTVNEARSAHGLDPLEDGDDPLDVYKAKKAEEAKKNAEAAAPAVAPAGAAPVDANAEAALKEAKAKTEGLLFNKSDVPAIITVDEARAMIGLTPLGTPDGSLTVAQWKARQVSMGTEVGKAQAEDVAGATEPEPQPAPAPAISGTRVPDIGAPGGGDGGGAGGLPGA